MNRRNFLGMLSAIAIVLVSGQTFAKRSGGGSDGASKKSESRSSYRSAKSGRYVKKGYADKRPNTTVKEKRK